MKTIVKPLFVAFSASFLIFGLIFQVLGKKIDAIPKRSDLLGVRQPADSLERSDLQKEKELSCFKDKDGDGKVELSLLNETQEEKEFDCLLLGCNLYEFE